MWKETGKLVDRPVSIFESFKPLIGEYSIQFANTPEFQRRKKAYISPAFSMRAIQNLHYKAVEDNLKDWCLPFLK